MQASKKILIADDEHINREMLKIIFGQNYEFIDAEDGEKAIEKIQQFGSSINLILLDLNMPKVNGFQVLEFLKDNGLLADIPVIVVTAENGFQTPQTDLPDGEKPVNFNDELRVYQCGATDIIRKPFIPEIVLMKALNLMELYAGRKNLALQLQERTAELIDTKKYDALTGLLNMKQFLAAADEILQNADEQECKEYAFLYANIRNFKYFNVQYGMENGDIILKNLAVQIQGIAENKLNARFGQDHFVTLTKSPGLIKKIRALNDDFEEQFGYIGMHLKIGVYHLQKVGEKASAACELAKIACDSIRRTSDYVCEYSDSLGKQIDISAYVIQNINEAIRKEYIDVYYQPVARTINGQICGVEALARWIDPEKGFMSPGDFIPVLEENRLITQLDLHILRKTCEGMKSLEADGKEVVPVSFNLSRVDFEMCDIYHEVNQIVMEYGIPRDMINVEVTESTIMQNPEKLKREIKRFRDGGYQVWMDDFGSGYSSLNVLKEYDFDEIKLDMKFMTSFDERSKEIVKSIVYMAKNIGVQTLAEGVETQEQFDFLRYIGCEKVQGYLISKPIPSQDMRRFEETNREQIEQRAWRNYYDRIGTSNFVTDKPLAIAEFDGKDIAFSYYNHEFQSVLESLGASDMKIVYCNMNSPTSPISQQFRALRKYCHVGNGVKQITYTIRGQYVRLSVRCLAEHDNKGAFELEIVNLTDLENKRSQLDRVNRMMYALFDMVCKVNLNTKEFEFLKQGDSMDLPEQDAFHAAERFEIAMKAAVSLIHYKDREFYLKFMAIDTLKQRILEEGKDYITEYFRTKTWNGAYIWKAHTLLYIADLDVVIYCTHFSPVVEHQFVERITDDLGIRRNEDISNGFMKFIHRGIMESKTINMFWKDTNRRFLGANENFLKTYGFDSVSDILGKTDEDMHWHIEENAFADDEWRVLKNGEIIINRMGRCIINGVAHNIMASKEPLYDNGVIVGLIGYFINVDDLNDHMRPVGAVGVKDHITGLMSPQGLIDMVSEYIEEWQLRTKSFATIRVSVNEYYRVTKNFGETTANAMLKEIAGMIAEVVGNEGTCARLYLGNFVVLMRYEDKAQIHEMARNIQKKLDDIHELAGYAATIHPHIEISFVEDNNDVLSMLGLITQGTLLDIANRKGQSTNLNLIWNTYENIEDNVYAADMDTYDLIYMNRHARESCGFSSLNDIHGKKCYEVIQGLESPCEFCNNHQLINEKPCEWEFFNSRFGTMYRLRDQMLVYNGHRIRIEHAVELVPNATKKANTGDERIMLLISECMRLALENTDPNRGLDNLLKYLGRTLSCERTYIFEMTDHHTWNNTYEWCAEGVSEEIDHLQDIPIDETEVWNETLYNGDFVMIRDVNDIRESDPKVYEYLLPQNIQSLIVVPIYVDHKLSGFAGLDNPPKPQFDEIAKQIKTVSHVIETMLEKRNLIQNMNRLSYQDSLLNLGNRHAVERFFAQIDRSKSIGVAFCDVCGLKTVNDALGHDAGDRLLLQVCDMVRKEFKDDHVFRWGGDEILVLSSGVGEDEFSQKCDRLKKYSIEQNAPLAVGAVWRGQVLDLLEDLVREADTRMYENKQILYSSNNIKATLMNNTQLRRRH